jgi:hypothetical protein
VISRGPAGLSILFVSVLPLVANGCGSDLSPIDQVDTVDGGAGLDGGSTGADAGLGDGAAGEGGAPGDAGDADTSGDGGTGGDAGSASLVWYPGNYGVVTTGNNAARDAFLTGRLAGSFIGVEMVYPWSSCEGPMGDYSACFAAMDADIAAVPAGKHMILFLQYKGFSYDAVPAYLQGPGAWCVTVGATQVCGQYQGPQSTIAMIWNTAVADRLHAWFTAVAAHFAPGGAGAAHANRLAGIVLPETAPGSTGPVPLASVGYTAAKYVAAIEDNLTTLVASFPNLPAFQYINFLPQAVPSESAALKSLADWALTKRNIGLGCPDVGGSATFSPPGYDVLMNAAYQTHLPFNVAIEPMDYDAPITTGLAATYAEATGKAPNGMAAQFVVWQYVTGASHVFTIDDVAAYLPSHPNPNVALPTY